MRTDGHHFGCWMTLYRTWGALRGVYISEEDARDAYIRTYGGDREELSGHGVYRDKDVETIRKERIRKERGQ